MTINLTVKDLHVHIRGEVFDVKQLLETVSIINSKLDTIMANIAELTAKADALQTSLDAEQEQIKAAIDGLNQSITDLKALVTDGGTAEERQALADKLDAIKTDLEGTIPDAAPNP